jgi:hypothetical protein
MGILPPALAVGRFALQLEEWQILAELRDATKFASWSKNTEGWDTLEEHRDPSRCAGITVESEKIIKIELRSSNLVGGESLTFPPCA